MDENRVIKKGTKLEIHCNRKGKYKAVAREDFTLADTWYPVIVAESEFVKGLSRDWGPGDVIPCRASFVSHVEVLEEVTA